MNAPRLIWFDREVFYRALDRHDAGMTRGDAIPVGTWHPASGFISTSRTGGVDALHIRDRRIDVVLVPRAPR